MSSSSSSSNARELEGAERLGSGGTGTGGGGQRNQTTTTTTTHSEREAGERAAEVSSTSTLKRNMGVDEDLILLRQTDSGNKLSAMGLRQRRASCVPASQQEKDEDTNSVTTTTSDVNSDDDAASIVSRLSQIVVEQEGKLLGCLAGAMDAGGGFSGAGGGGGGQNHVAGSNSTTNESDGARKSNKRSPQHQDGGGGSGSMLEQRSTREPVAAEGRLPKIQVIDDESGGSGESTIKMRSNKSDRVRAKSVVEPKLEPGPGQGAPGMVIRRNESSGYLPERGDLRSLENSRKQPPPTPPQAQVTSSSSLTKESGSALIRHRSHTAGSADQPHPDAAGGGGAGAGGDTGGQLMLNIRRSAWTLSDFDQQFNKSGDKSETSSTSEILLDRATEVVSTCLDGANQTVINSIMTAPQTVAVAAAAAATGSKPVASILQQPQQQQQQHQQQQQLDKQNNNLLIRASKNAISMNQHPTPAGVNGAGLELGGRYQVVNNCPAGVTLGQDEVRRHSVVSFSSLDSYCNKKALSEKLRRRDSQPADDDNDDVSSSPNNCFRSCCNLDTFGQYLPILNWLPGYNKRLLWGDITAGLAVAVLNISTSLSAAVVAETSLGAAFRASIVNTFVYAILCSSRHTSFGSWSIMSQMLLNSVNRALADELLLSRLNIGPGHSGSWNATEYERWHLNIIIMYTFLIGVTQLLGGLLNLGNILASFIPEALCSSMIAATAFTMAVGQLANMCGTSNKILWSIEKNTTALWADLKNPPVDITDLFAGLFRWIQQIALLIKYNEQINMVCVMISIGSVIVLFLNQCVIQKQLEKQFKRKIFIPFEMILLIVMIILSYSLGLKENYNVATCGPIDIDFDIPNLPNLKLIRELWFESLATALISYSMVYIMAKTYSNKLNYEVDCNQELIACGAGNLIGGLFDALPATASFSRTAGQVEAGGHTQMASLINCIVLVILAKLLGHHVAALPICVMAATLFFGFVRMMTRFMEVFNYWRVCKVDFAIWLVTFVAILTLDLVNGFVYGFIFSILTMLYRAQNRRCYMLGSIGSSDVYVPLIKYPIAQEIEGIKIFQFCGPIHYVCADLFERLLRRKTRVDVKRIAKHIAEQEVVKFNPRDMNLPSHIILDFSMISFIDSAGINIIKKIIEDYQSVNVTVLLASLASHVAAVVKSEPAVWETYKERFYITLADAVHCAIRDSRLQQNEATLESIAATE